MKRRATFQSYIMSRLFTFCLLLPSCHLTSSDQLFLEIGMDLVNAQRGNCCKAARFLILFASQTGNAKAIAENISEECEAKGLVHSISCTSENEKFSLETTDCVVFVGSTTGDGDPPDTARKFWRSINKKDKSCSAFAHLSYTVLGLGDTNYTNFCNFGKSVDRIFQNLGAKRFYPCGWADDGTGLEVVVEPWIEGLFPALREHLKYEESCSGSLNVNESKLSPDPFDTNKNESELLVINKNSGKMMSDICSEKTDLIMEKSDHYKNTELDAFEIANKLGLCVLQQKQLEGLSVKSCHFPTDAKLSVPVLSASYLVLKYQDALTEDSISNFKIPILNAASSVSEMKLISLKQLTARNAVKTAFEVKLQFRDTSDIFDYLPGDSFGILIKNPRAEVNLLLILLGISDVADKTYELTVDPATKKKNASVPGFIPTVGSLRYVFENCVDLRSVPKKPFIRTLIEYTSDPKEKQRLKELVSKEGSGEYSKFVRECNLTILDLLIIFQSCKPPVTVLLEHLPQLQPRAYSVISSPRSDPRQISFAFNVIEIKQGETVTFPRKGICTGWLSSFVDLIKKNEDHLGDMHLNETFEKLTLLDKNEVLVNVYLRSNQNFHLHKDNSIPIVMVGPGTGVAPFVGFLKHRQALMLSGNESEFGESWLFFGCRHRNRDYLYREELEKFHHDKILSHLKVCFSRDEDSAEGPKYVQDNIKLYGADLVSLIVDKRAIVYVCGDAKNMAKDVFEAFTSILEVNNDLSTVEARKYIAQMQIDKRYLQDVWA